MKKLISLILILAMLVPFTPAKATSEPASTPTIEEILNGYHDKAFEASIQGENGSASTWSGRSGDSKTLEQETVEQLTAAGYEAYNVTGENYDAVADALNTDLAAMGLDPEGSYIVVISDVPPGETPDSNAGNNSRVAVPPVQEDFEGDAASTFTYTQDGTTYTMRYVTVTAAVAASQLERTIYLLSGVSNLTENVNDLASWTLSAVIDEVTHFPFASLYDLYVDYASDEDLIYLDLDNTAVFAATSWTRNYIQIYKNSTNEWKTAQYSTYATAKVCCAGYEYNAVLDEPVFVTGEETVRTIYSPLYNYVQIRLQNAVAAYTVGQISTDRTGNIHYKVSSMGVSSEGVTQGLFTHYEWTGYYVPAQPGD